MPPTPTVPDPQELDYERPAPPKVREAKRSLTIGAVALALFTPVWAAETFVPVDVEYVESVAVFFLVLVAASIAVGTLGIIVSLSALAARRDRHPLAIVGLFLNLATLSSIGWFFYSVFSDY